MPKAIAPVRGFQPFLRNFDRLYRHWAPPGYYQLPLRDSIAGESWTELAVNFLHDIGKRASFCQTGIHHVYPALDFSFAGCFDFEIANGFRGFQERAGQAQLLLMGEVQRVLGDFRKAPTHAETVAELAFLSRLERTRCACRVFKSE